MTHTPTPWRIEHDYEWEYTIRGADDEWIANNTDYYPTAPNDANAAYIVECVNSHASLVEENERLKRQLERATDDAEHWAGKWGQDTIRLENEIE